MSSADDVIDRLNKLIKTIQDLDGEFGSSIDEVNDAIDRAQDLGHEVPIQAFTNVRHTLEDLRKPLDAMESDTERLRSVVEEFGKDS